MRTKNVNILPKIRVEMRNEKDLNSKGETTLRYVVRLKGMDKMCRSSNINIKPSLWNKKKQMAIGDDEHSSYINSIILNKKADFDTYFKKIVFSSGTRITMKMVVDYFEDKRFDCLLSYFDKILQERAKINESATTVKDLVCRKRLEEFALKEKYKNLNFMDVDLKFVQKFDTFLVNELRMQSGSANNYHKVLKVLFKEALLDGIIESSPYNGFKPRTTEKNNPKDVLNLNEIKALREFKVADNNKKHLETTKNVFLFMLNTGLRFSDVKNASIRDLRLEGESLISSKNYLELKQKKTKEIVKVILNKEARKMIHLVRQAKENNEDKLFGNLCLQAFNRNLKILAKLTKINKKLSSHVARHTFATALHNEHGVSKDNIAHLLGQKDTDMANVYIRRNNFGFVDSLENLYSFEEVA
ncbi:MAG: tyrosine-type recombinase/integrase [Bacteroidia bacterium]